MIDSSRKQANATQTASRVPVRIATVRSQFDARAARFSEHAELPDEIRRRMLDRLDYIRIAPSRVLDIGCGAGESLATLAARYPSAEWIGIDVSERMLRSGVEALSLGRRLFRRFSRPRALRIVGEGGCLPLADESVDLALSNLMLHWHPEPHAVLPEWKRVLRIDGLLMFSCFGPDTLKELRAAALEALPHARPVPFVDMHDFGDMLVASGFATPVMDVEVLTLTYATPHALLAEVRALGGNPRDDRWAALPSTRQARRLLAALDGCRNAEGRIPLTFEIAYGHAWKPSPRPAAAGITLDSVRAELASHRRRSSNDGRTDGFR
jgi:malonyl-CoA O-methyltransferase